jgi:hypothetical protein
LPHPPGPDVNGRLWRGVFGRILQEIDQNTHGSLKLGAVPNIVVRY